MDFKDLTYIIAVAKYQNITKAADPIPPAERSGRRN